MNKFHAPHPTQSAACGVAHTAYVLNDERFAAAPEHRKCKRCVKVLAAFAAGRPAFAGYEDPETGERGPRRRTVE